MGVEIYSPIPTVPIYYIYVTKLTCFIREFIKSFVFDTFVDLRNCIYVQELTARWPTVEKWVTVEWLAKT